ncbi:MAG TPA: YqgE/AlgH family protein [Marmoricola sp.]|nr:YqgE/AlgH family protein [Marmoricola sp.]HNO40271.1 YqgE/AlgH family protein [Marmoricola sp.]
MRTPAAGMLLVASPEMTDPNFAGTVVLLLEVNPDGALGVVLNRPTPIRVGHALEGWEEKVTEPQTLFAGGPCEPNAALAIGQAADPQIPPIGFAPVTDTLGMIELDTPPELIGTGLANLRIFAGYAGWGSGQLEAELEELAWYLLPGFSTDVFRSDSSHLRRDVLARQPGSQAWHATRPMDPSQN